MKQLKVFCASMLLLVAASLVTSQSDCSLAESCDMCVGQSLLNLTGCVWRLCPYDNDVGKCVNDRGSVEDSSMNCSWTRVSELCSFVEVIAEGGDNSDSADKPAPEFSQAKFNMSSFIGGIILVLVLQAGGFVAMRFLKSKEQSSYDPIEQPQ